MTFKVTTVKTRPVSSIPWISDIDPGSNLTGTADHSGKLITNSNTIGDDGLSITTVQIWASKQVYLDYVSLEEVSALRLTRSIHQINNMIGVSINYEELA